MSVKATNSNVELSVGGIWEIVAHVRDLDGCLTDAATPVVTITLPAGSTASPTVERLGTGCYRASYAVASTGRYVARVVAAGYGADDMVAYVSGTTAETSMPTLADAKVYLKLDPEDDTQDVEVADALAAETDAQRAVCRVSAVYPNDLRQALLRRVARNLALRGLPIMVLRGDSEAGPLVLPGRDPEVRRLEGPHRRVVFA